MLLVGSAVSISASLTFQTRPYAPFLAFFAGNVLYFVMIYRHFYTSMPSASLSSSGTSAVQGHGVVRGGGGVGGGEQLLVGVGEPAGVPEPSPCV